MPAALLALLLALPLAGCSGSRFGESLSRSFSAPAAPTPPAVPGAAAPAAPAAGGRPGAARNSEPGVNAVANGTPATVSTPGTAAPPTTPPAAAAPPTATAGSAAPRAGSQASPTPAAAGTTPPRTAPYRVTLLLPRADAAAPAEVVTQALRAAGVPFEVETIERLSGSSGAATGSGSPGATGRRPAPEPR
jgi:hypothetical protein